MGFLCHATNEVVTNETRVLIPIKIRKVVYIAQMKTDQKSEYLQFAGQSEGWEIVQEVAVRKSKADEFALTCAPEVVGEKEVRFLKPRQIKEKFVRRDKDSDDDKSED